MNLNFQTFQETFQLWIQRYDLQKGLLEKKNAVIQTLGDEKQQLLAQIADLKAEKVVMATGLTRKSQEAYNLAIQVSELNSQYNTSEVARSYAASQVVTLGEEIKKTEAALTEANKVAATLAEAEVEEDAVAAAVAAELAEIHTQLESLGSQITDRMKTVEESGSDRESSGVESKEPEVAMVEPEVVAEPEVVVATEDSSENQVETSEVTVKSKPNRNIR